MKPIDESRLGPLVGRSKTLPHFRYILQPKENNQMTVDDAVSLYHSFLDSERIRPENSMFFGYSETDVKMTGYTSRENVARALFHSGDASHQSLENFTLGCNRRVWFRSHIHIVSVQPEDDRYVVELLSNVDGGFTYLKNLVDTSLGDRFIPRLPANSPAWDL